MGPLVGVKGIEPNVLFSDGFTIRCLTLRRHSRVLVVLGRIELPSNDYQSLALPLSYRTMEVGVRVELTTFVPGICNPAPYRSGRRPLFYSKFSKSNKKTLRGFSWRATG